MASEQYLPPRCGFTLEDGVVYTDGKYRTKVSGTSMAGILECSPWATPFTVACNLMGIGKKDLSKKSAIIAGQKLEPVIIDYIGKRYPEFGIFLSADEVYGKREGDHDSWASDFDDDVFSGHVDGIVMAEDGQEYILEIKTSSNMEAWVDEDGVGRVPEYYFWQVALYNHYITKKDKAYVALGLLERGEAEVPDAWEPTDENVFLFEVQIDQEKVAETIAEVREWYETYVCKDQTPRMQTGNIRDMEMWNHLLNVSAPLMDMNALVDFVERQSALIKAMDDETGRTYMDRDLSDAKKRIKEYLLCNPVSSVPGTNTIAVLNETWDEKFDRDAMIADGIPIDKYILKTPKQTLYFKKNKE